MKLYVKVCIFWKCFQYTIHWEKTKMFKNFLSNKINGTKNALFFLLRATTQHSFTFNLKFLIWAEAQGSWLWNCVWDFQFWNSISFLLKFWFFFNKMQTLWLQTVIIAFKINIIEKPHIVLLSHLWLLSCNKKF